VPRARPSTLPDADRIRAYQQQLVDDEARLQQVQQEAARTTRTVGVAPTGSAPRTLPTDPVADETRRREVQSLFADNVAFSRRAGQPSTATRRASDAPDLDSPALSPETQAVLQALAASAPRPAAVLAPAATPAAVSPTPAPPPVASAPPGIVDHPTSVASAPPAVVEHPAPGPRLPLLQGSLIETVLLNRLDGTFAGPVTCLVTTPVYAQDRQAILIPAGARVLGTAAPVQAWGDTRLAVSFHRLVMPDGHTYSLERATGLDAIGETGLTDAVNRHYWQVFGASIAIGAVSGLAQYTTRGVDANSFGDTYRQAAGASLASSSTRVLDRYLNVLPTITIREGHRIEVYLTSDVALPVYDAPDGGGIQ
jgi:type IV secretion system protein VirB10